MNTLHVAYQILKSLETKRKADYMSLVIGPEKLKIDNEQWMDVIRSLQHEGYIRGVVISTNILDETEVDIENIKITVKGAEYLHENSAMKKIGEVATNVITIAKP